MKKLLALIPVALVVASGCSLRGPAAFAQETDKSFAAKNSDLSACYSEVLKTEPTASGTVDIAFTWQKKSGAFSDLNVSGGTAPQSVKDCVTKNLVGLTMYPADAQDGKGNWTFTFTSTAPAVTGTGRGLIGPRS
jgi:nitrogen fixation-related uncharacterized protein